MTTRSLRLSSLSVALLLALSTAPALAQNTTSALDGHVVTVGGQPVAGADLAVVHVPSGTTTHVTADAQGRFHLAGLRVGGPYTVTITQNGSTTTTNNVYLDLATTRTLDLTVGKDAVTDLAAVDVTGSSLGRVFNSANKGLGVTLNHAELQAVPDAGRSIQDIARMDPQISITDRDAGAISANGQPFRYNCISVDNVNAGDPFGLEANGLASVDSPMSKETIASYRLSTSNFDVSTRGCVGANINAVTKSGTNDVHGSVYYSFRNSDSGLMGKINPIGGNQSMPYTGWGHEWVSGFTVGGPLIQDKLFFFAGYEHSSRVGIGPSSAPFDGTGSTTLVPGVSTAFVDAVEQTATQKGLQPGDLSLANLTDYRYLAKIDWNIADGQRAVLRFAQTQENQPVPTGSILAVAPNSNWYEKSRDIKSVTGQLFSDWSDTFSTEADVQFTHVTQNRGPLAGGYQPMVQVTISPVSTFPGVVLGTDASSQLNALDIKSWYGSFSGTWNLGSHVVQAGFNANQDKVDNAFVQGAEGVYTYLGLANFQAGNWAEYAVRQVAPGLTLDQASARFTKHQYGAFVQDTWQVNDGLSVQYGVRFDAPSFGSSPLLNPCFAATPGTPFLSKRSDGSILCAAPKGGFGFANNATPSSKGTFEPRLSFNYQFDTQRKTQLRGGIGMFVNDVPTVWYSDAYSNSGITTVTYDILNPTSSPAGTVLCSLNGKVFVPSPVGFCPPGTIGYVKQGPVYTPGSPLIPGSGPLVLGSNVAQMAVDTIDPNFKMPKTTQFALAFDRELPWWGMIGTVEYNFTQTNEAINYKNLNLGASTFTGQDGRQYFCNMATAFACASTPRANANPAFGAVTELTNTHQGQSSTLTFSLNRPMADGWAGLFAVRLGHATDVNPGTSSVANSNIAGGVWTNPNTDATAPSNYDVPRRVLTSVTWEHHFFGNYATDITLLGDMHSGAPYSWISGTDTNGDGYARDLVYIPRSVGDVEWASFVTDAQKQQFINYIGSDSYLSKHAGQIAGRNAERAPWVNQFDLSFRQEIPGLFKDHRGELRFDIFNLGNLVNKGWGVERRAPGALTRNLANVSGIDPVTGKYIYALPVDANGNYAPGQFVINEGQTAGAPDPSQRWSVSLTATYSF